MPGRVFPRPFLVMDSYLPYILLVGLAITAMGFVALIAAAFQESLLWGLGVLAFPPSGAVFVVKHPGRSTWPTAVLALGIMLVATPILYNRLIPIDLGPREKKVDGEVHLTLTGWDRQDYALIRRKPEVVVLQMANPDVDDQTLRLLPGLNRLRELDLNGSKVTDEGLKSLAQLERLESLKLRGTAVSDQGFRETLNRIDTLKQLDLRGTKVSPEQVKSWREARPGRRALR